MTGGWQLGIDIGGTFTDVVAFEPATGTLRSAKAQSRPGDPLASVRAGLAAVGLDWRFAPEIRCLLLQPKAELSASGHMWLEYSRRTRSCRFTSTASCPGRPKPTH